MSPENYKLSDFRTLKRVMSDRTKLDENCIIAFFITFRLLKEVQKFQAMVLQHKYPKILKRV